jgi:hypothetical protein
MATRIITVTPAIASFATPFTADDVVGEVNTVLSMSGAGQGVDSLGSIVLIDYAKQKAATDIFFFDSLPTISADNAAFDMTDANAAKCIGFVSIAAADYVDSASNSIATKRGVSLLMPGVNIGEAIYCVFVTRGTPTYTAAGDLVCRFGFYDE